MCTCLFYIFYKFVWISTSLCYKSEYGADCRLDWIEEGKGSNFLFFLSKILWCCCALFHFVKLRWKRGRQRVGEGEVKNTNAHASRSGASMISSGSGINYIEISPFIWIIAFLIESKRTDIMREMKRWDSRRCPWESRNECEWNRGVRMKWKVETKKHIKTKTWKYVCPWLPVVSCPSQVGVCELPLLSSIPPPPKSIIYVNFLFWLLFALHPVPIVQIKLYAFHSFWRNV